MSCVGGRIHHEESLLAVIESLRAVTKSSLAVTKSPLAVTKSPLAVTKSLLTVTQSLSSDCETRDFWQMSCVGGREDSSKQGEKKLVISGRCAV